MDAHADLHGLCPRMGETAMTWEVMSYLGQMTATIIFYAFLFGAGVSGLVFTGAFCLWLWDKFKKEMVD